MSLKRSTINRAIDDAIDFFRVMRFPLPAWAFWTPAQWAEAGPDYDEVRRVRLGWDATDFGSGDFARIGRTIFTLRNGRHGDAAYPKTYAEKAMFLAEGQKSVVHLHRSKREDIICRGGGNVLIRVWQSTPENGLSDAPCRVSLDGRLAVVAAGEAVHLRPGESICIVPGMYHQFWAEEGAGAALSMEVSSVCDDLTDNYFHGAGQRFPVIEEDEPSRHVLCSEYGRAERIEAP